MSYTNYTQYLGDKRCCNINKQGPIGPIGYTGANGPIGPAGVTGPTGFTGPIGTSFWLSTGTTGIYYNGGNVGINNISPTYTLDVVGNARFTQDCSINSLTVGLGGGNVSSNTVLGCQALVANTSGNENTAIGFNSGQTNITGSNNTFIGFQANASGNNFSNSTALGNGATVTASNQIVLGNSSISTLQCQVALSVVSDRRDKKDITPLEAGINFIEKLQPVNFKWNMRDGGKIDIPETGFIAQDLQEAQKETNTIIPNLVNENNPEKLSVTYNYLLPVMVKAIQDLNKKNQELENKIKLLENANK